MRIGDLIHQLSWGEHRDVVVRRVQGLPEAQREWLARELLERGDEGDRAAAEVVQEALTLLAEEPGWEEGHDALAACCCWFYLFGEPVDVLRIHRAKRSNFDAGCMIDHDFLTMRQDQEHMSGLVRRLAGTLDFAYVQTLAEDIDGAFTAPNYESSRALVCFWLKYFGIDAGHPPV